MELPDALTSQQVAIITENLAHYYFPGQNPIGRRVGLQRQLKAGPAEIVGVVRDVKFEGVAGDSAHMVYMPAAEETIPHSRATFALRSDRATNDLVAAVRAQVQGQHLGIPIAQMKTMRRQLDESVARERLLATLSSFFGLLALLLASAGIYGLMAYGVSRRVNEIGIRMALGARVADVVWLVLRETLVLVALGVAVGLPVALIASQSASRMLFRLTAEDPATLGAAAGILGMAAVIAAYLPARRAAMVNPVTALRYE
jgi:predicted lysophospholipase L1 biosynthesis ABC-type transport system permease subunit